MKGQIRVPRTLSREKWRYLIIINIIYPHDAGQEGNQKEMKEKRNKNLSTCVNSILNNNQAMSIID